jgi:hypothetical protein
MKRINLIKDFFLLKNNMQEKNINSIKNWIVFKDKWEKYKD